ncbi:YsnF/AvaK domain-containing protein [uncultured Methylobacterium sp.]|uniref:YsnF/AvaK domain-containing protein n=1 Tax=uncultured Methylobacterium sp. TaxID=157278 RepID=UPI0035CA7592
MTTRTITALYDSYDDATRAVTKLEAAGIPHGDISLVGNDGRTGTTDRTTTGHGDTADAAETGAGTGATLGTVLGGGAGLLAGLGLMAIPGVGPVVAAGWLVATLTGAGIGAAAGGLAGSLTGAGLSETDAETYAEGVRRGGTLLTVRADEAHETRVMDILEEHGSVDLDERERTWKSEGWTGGSATSGTTNTPRVDTSRVDASRTAASAPVAAAASGTVGRGETIPVVEEKLHVGKRDVEQGRVRVRSYAVETPVNEQVRLHDENVHVDRRPVDRALTDRDTALFKDRTIEATERTEVPVVSKEARVVEEVGLRKDATQRTETVSDSVRRTEVEVEDERGNVSRTGTTDPLTKR